MKLELAFFASFATFCSHDRLSAQRRIVRDNGEDASLSTHIDLVRLVWIQDTISGIKCVMAR